jgi:hypothetical protein
VRGDDLSIEPNPLTPSLSSLGRGSRRISGAALFSPQELKT